jgi:FMN-dependent NADH-azoreductase
MPHLLNIQSSPRGARSASIAIADAFLHTYLELHPETTIDTLNVSEERLPEYDAQGIGAKYKGRIGEVMSGVEAQTWETIEALAARFRKADRIVVGVPMWNLHIRTSSNNSSISLRSVTSCSASMARPTARS